MPIETLRKELRKIGRLMNFWQAELWAAMWTAIAAGVLWIAGISDLFLHFGFGPRSVFWGLTLAACAYGAWRVWRALATARSLEAIAARVEQVFPQLDNRLINVVQFAGAGGNDPMRRLYIRQGVPNWGDVRVKELKERKKHRRAYVALGVAILFLGIPFFWMSEAWGNALVRILNPFSLRSPSTLAQIRSVTPGSTKLVSGNPLTIRVRAEGHPGQPVTLDFWPTDDKPESIRIGQLSGGRGVEEFSYQVPKVMANLAYRVRAGDASSEKFQVSALPPISLTRLDVTVTPGKESGLPERQVNALTTQVVVPQGAAITVAFACNRPLLRGQLIGSGVDLAALEVVDGGKALKGTTVVKGAGILMLTGYADGDEKFESALKIEVDPDHPPVIHIIAPTGRTVLSAGAVPTIQWEASDDFGLSRMAVEQVPLDAVNSSDPSLLDRPGQIAKEWKLANERTASQTWKGEPLSSGTVAFRVVANDNFNAGQGEPHRAVSPVLIFQTAAAKEVADAANKSADEAQAMIAKLVALQSKNLARTRELGASIAAAKPEQWTEAQDAQKEIRRITGLLLGDPKRPLATLHEKLLLIYQQPMEQVIGVLGGIPTADDAQRATLAARAVQLEDWILRILSGIDAALPKAEQNRQITDILTAMDQLVKAQKTVNAATAAALEKPGTSTAPLAKRQDHLSGDADQFVEAAKAEAANVKGTDSTFSELIAKVAEEMGTRKISADMLKAADQLDGKAPSGAVPFQESALKNLSELQAMLNSWRVEKAEQQAEALTEEMKNAAAKLDKMMEMQRKVMESMRALKPNEDQTTGRDSDESEELKKKNEALKEALLKVATDLHIFPNSDVGNEVTKEILTTFQKVDQLKGSEHAKFVETGLQKEDFILKDMDKVAKRIKDGIATLQNAPDTFNRLTENFDKQEMAKMAMVPLGDKVEDLIGDLLKQDSEIADKMKASATNQATKDLLADGAVSEGEYANYSAKGKSGNMAPKHNEQSGRSNIGRQGQSNGEAAAGAGKINKGDDNLEKRMTQDGAQSGEMGKIDDSEAKTVATGGGKMSGSADEYGMAGQGPRRDAQAAGSAAGEQALMRKNAEAIYAQATLQHVRTGSLDSAVRHMREAEEAIRQGRPIQEIREFQKLARESLQKTQVELSGGTATVSIDGQPGAAQPVPEQMAGTVDEAPAAYQGMVSDYYKAISGAPH